MVFGKGNEAWRNHPLISNGHRAAFPGLRNAAIIFGVYCAAEYAYKSFQQDDHHSHAAHEPEKPASNLTDKSSSTESK
eukprot:maker-scaffold_24-snap-gene-3.39-mRNA-1 protein AED:0.40 eAED:0.40 QI:104/1/1/1/1/1/3/95/77